MHISARVDYGMRALLILIALFFSTSAQAERIKDMGQFEGLRANQLTGYGVVVGLAGTGDDSLDYATQGVKGAISRFGVNLPAGINPALKNAAAVVITAELPPFAKPGLNAAWPLTAMGTPVERWVWMRPALLRMGG